MAATPNCQVIESVNPEVMRRVLLLEVEYLRAQVTAHVHVCGAKPNAARDLSPFGQD